MAMFTREATWHVGWIVLPAVMGVTALGQSRACHHCGLTWIDIPRSALLPSYRPTKAVLPGWMAEPVRYIAPT